MPYGIERVGAIQFVKTLALFTFGGFYGIITLIGCPIDKLEFDKGGHGMKKYEYVNININSFIGAGSKEHRQIIDEYAARGYRYVGYVPTDINDHGKIKAIDLIFEIDQ